MTVKERLGLMAMITCLCLAVVSLCTVHSNDKDITPDVFQRERGIFGWAIQDRR